MKRDLMKKGLAGTAVAALAVVGVLGSSAVAHAAPGMCMPLNPDNPLSSDGTAKYQDNNPTIYVRGNLDLQNHEGEGLVVVEGDMNVKLENWGYTLGAGAGGGSGAWPADGALMLSVGGNLTIDTSQAAEWANLMVGTGAGRQGGQWFVGGDVTPEARVDAQSQRITDKASPEELAGTPVPGYRDRINGFNNVLDNLSTNAANGVVGRLAFTGSRV